MKKLVALTGIVAGLCFTTNAQTAFQASMTIDQEPGGTGSGRTGSGTASLTLNGSDLSYSISFSGLSSPTTQGHIHGPTATSQPPAATFPVLHPFTFTTGTTAGSFSGTWTGLTPTQISDLNAGFMYVNIHSVAFPGGEIRGAITAVPEPSTYALLAMAGLAGLGLRKKKA
jgi:hypothetical protein